MRQSRTRAQMGLDSLRHIFESQHAGKPGHWNLPDEISGYFTQKGKRLRPLFFLASHGMVTAQSKGLASLPYGKDRLAKLLSTHALAIASCVERFHDACLALDDIWDNSDLRRGGRALHLLIADWIQLHGSKSEQPAPRPEWLVLDIATWTVADLWMALLGASGSPTIGPPIRCEQWWGSSEPFSVAEVFQTILTILEKLRSDAQSRLGNGPLQYGLLADCLVALQETLDGERMDLLWPNSHVPSIQELTVLWRLKTSQYSVVFPLKAGARLADPSVSFEVLAHLEAFGLAFGEAFQIRDDLLVLNDAGSADKSILADLEQGSMTTVTVLMHSWMTLQGRGAEWLALLKACKDSSTTVAHCLELIGTSPVEGQAREMIRERVATCLSSLANLEQAGYDTSFLRHMALTV